MAITKSTNVIFLLFFIFAKVLPMLPIVADRQKHAHTQTDTDKLIAIGEILHICLMIANLYRAIGGNMITSMRELGTWRQISYLHRYVVSLTWKNNVKCLGL